MPLTWTIYGADWAGNTSYWRPDARFFRRWPDLQRWADESLQIRLSAGSATRPITFLMLHGGLRPGCDYLLQRKLSPIWREIGRVTCSSQAAGIKASVWSWECLKDPSWPASPSGLRISCRRHC
jgi:hypothetical protein